MKTEERLEFRYDLHDPKSVYTFPEAFAQFIARYGSKEDVDAFLELLAAYIDSTGDEDLNFGTICNIAAEFADLVDISGVPFDENSFLGVDGAKTAEDILKELEEEAEAFNERDEPLQVGPEFPDVWILVHPDDDLPMLLFRAIVALREASYRLAADRLARDARQLLKEKPAAIQMLRLIESYILVDYDHAIETAIKRKEKEDRQ